MRRMNQEARHWARLNAGAGPIGQGSRGRFPVRWSNLVVASLGLDMDARPAFFLPRGYWFSPGEGLVSPNAGRTGKDEFYPQGTSPGGPFSHLRSRRRLDGKKAGGHEGPGLARRRPSKGIRGRQFLDAGVARIGQELGPTYERLYENLWKQGTIGRAGNVTTRVVGPKPSRLGGTRR